LLVLSGVKYNHNRNLLNLVAAFKLRFNMKLGILHQAFLSLICCAMLSIGASAQEWQSIETPVETNLILYDISFPAGQNDIGYVVGSNVTYNGKGKILKTVNGGWDWEVIWESEVNGTGMESVFFVTTQIGYAGNADGSVMKTVNGGANWTTTDFDPGSDQGSILDIEFFNAMNGVLSSQWEGIYVTSNGGNTWTQATTNYIGAQDICYSSSTTLFGVGLGQVIYKSTNGGMTWTLNYTGNNMFWYNLGVHFSDQMNGLVTSEEGTVYVTNNGGNSWTEQNVDGQYGLMRGAWVNDANSMYATGTPGQVYVTVNGGLNWMTDSPLEFDPSYYKIIFTENGTGYVCGSGATGGTILRKGSGGCTDPEACNYSAEALEDDGSCTYPDGCIDPTACNYDMTAQCDDGTCILPDGCTDPVACNYDQAALCDDGSCALPDGCTDMTACNYDPAATCDDGTCVLPDGCTDPLACNYDELALCDDDSCVFEEMYYDCDGNCINDTDGDGICDELEVSGCTDPEACNYDELATDEDDSCEYVDALDISGNTIPLQLSEEEYSYPNTSGSTYEWTVTGGTIISGQGTNMITVDWGANNEGTVSVVETNYAGCVGPIVTVDIQLVVISTAEYDPVNLLVYPNPSNALIYVEAPGLFSLMSISVIDPLGKQVLSLVGSGRTAIDLGNEATGIYSLIVVVEGHSITKRIVVER
jgi:photosystem II stability/assembly factor-like uncharacterized protein